MTDYEQDLRIALVVLLSRAEAYRSAYRAAFYHAPSVPLEATDRLYPVDRALTEAVDHALEVLAS